MYFLEKAATGIRHLPVLCRINWFWDLVRPVYDLSLKLIFRKGLLRNIDGIGKIYICHECRNLSLFPAEHEVIWWQRLLQEVNTGDTVIDTGAFVGIFTAILAKKVGKDGKVIAFEPVPDNFRLLEKNVKLNEISGQVELFNFAIGKADKRVFLIQKSSASRVSTSINASTLEVKLKSLDEIIGKRSIDIIKIDVEGYEADVLAGANNLLRNVDGSPRFIFIECHPYVWKDFGTNSAEIITFLRQAGYEIEIPKLPGNTKLDVIQHHWAIFASKHR